MKHVKKKSKDMEDKYKDVTKIDKISYFKCAKEREEYHITVEFKLLGDRSILSDVFHKDEKAIAEFKPTVGFDFDLEYYTDAYLKYTIEDLFKKYETWISQLKDRYEQLSNPDDRYEVDSDSPPYLR